MSSTCPIELFRLVLDGVASRGVTRRLLWSAVCEFEAGLIGFGRLLEDRQLGNEAAINVPSILLGRRLIEATF